MVFLPANRTCCLGVVVVGILYQNAGDEPAQAKFPPSGKRNVIFMVSDGEKYPVAYTGEC